MLDDNIKIMKRTRLYFDILMCPNIELAVVVVVVVKPSDGPYIIIMTALRRAHYPR